MDKYKKPIWTRAVPKKRRNTTQILPLREVTSFVQPCQEKEPDMRLILSWEYGRKWLEERDQFYEKKSVKAKKPMIKWNIDWWLNKRKQKRIHPWSRDNNASSPHEKNTNLSAFVETKKQRELYNRASS